MLFGHEHEYGVESFLHHWCLDELSWLTVSGMYSVALFGLFSWLHPPLSQKLSPLSSIHSTDEEDRLLSYTRVYSQYYLSCTCLWESKCRHIVWGTLANIGLMKFHLEPSTNHHAPNWASSYVHWAESALQSCRSVWPSFVSTKLPGKPFLKFLTNSAERES